MAQAGQAETNAAARRRRAAAAKRKKKAEESEKRIEARKASVNAVAGRVRGLWLGYLTLGTYLFIAVGSVTHRQLFLEDPIRLPILNVDLPLIGFFAIAPLFFLVNHFYLLLTLLSLGRRIAEYNTVLGAAKLPIDLEVHQRRKLDSFVIVLALAGTEEERTGRTSTMLRTIAWLTVIGTPVILLLFMQLTFLPYHHIWVTWLHRGVLIVDLSLLWVFWPAIREGVEGLPVPMLWQKPFVAVLPVFLGISSIFLVTFPGESQDGNVIVSLRWVPIWQDPHKPNLIEISSDRRVATKRDRTSREEDQKGGFKPFSPYELLFLGKVNRTTGKRKSLWSNTLVLPDQDFVDDEKLKKITTRAKEEGKKPWEGERTKRFRGRDLRGAVLSRSDLRNTDFTGAKMQGANLRGAQIWQVKPLEKAQIEAADLRAIALRPPDTQALRKMLAEIEDEALRKRVEKRLERLLNLDEMAAWADSDESQVWGHFPSVPRPDPAAVTKILSNLACADNTGGYIIKGIARRISGYFERVEWHAGFTAAKLIDKNTCPAAKHLSEETLAELRKIAGPDAEMPEPKAVQ